MKKKKTSLDERVIKTFPLLTTITLGELINSSSMQDHALVLCCKKIVMKEFLLLSVRNIERRNNIINILHDNMH